MDNNDFSTYDAFRSAEVIEKTDETMFKLSDVPIKNESRDNYMGSSNGQVVCISPIDRKFLLYPIDRKVNNRLGNITTSENKLVGINKDAFVCTPNFFTSYQIRDSAFSPFTKNKFALTGLEHSSGASQAFSVGIFTYDENKTESVHTLNASVKQEAQFSENLVCRKSVELQWSHVVDNLLYVMGSKCIYVLVYLVNEKRLSLLTKLVGIEPKSQFFDFCLSPDGQYIGATVTVSINNRTVSQFMLYKTDYNSLSQNSETKPIFGHKCGKSISAKVCMLPSNRVIISRKKKGKRNIASFRFNLNGNEDTKFQRLSNLNQDGTSMVRVKSHMTFDVFYTYGRGDFSPEMFCLNDKGEILNFGIPKIGSVSMQGFIYLPHWHVDVNIYGIQEIIIAQGNSTKSNLTKFTFRLPRKDDPEELPCYEPIPCFVKSATLSDWQQAGSKNVPVKKLGFHDNVFSLTGGHSSSAHNDTLENFQFEQPKATPALKENKSFSKQEGNRHSIVNSPADPSELPVRKKTMDSYKTEIDELKHRVGTLEENVVDLSERLLKLEDLTTKTDLEDYGGVSV